jgi:hypothetical protein
LPLPSAPSNSSHSSNELSGPSFDRVGRSRLEFGHSSATAKKTRSRPFAREPAADRRPTSVPEAIVARHRGGVAIAFENKKANNDVACHLVTNTLSLKRAFRVARLARVLAGLRQRGTGDRSGEIAIRGAEGEKRADQEVDGDGRIAALHLCDP